MLTAWDCEKEAIRDFAWQDMRPVQNPATSAAALVASPASPDTRVVPRPEAVDALAAYQQADMDGTMVLVSRQAIEECLPSLRAIIGGQDRG